MMWSGRGGDEKVRRGDEVVVKRVRRKNGEGREEVGSGHRNN